MMMLYARHAKKGVSVQQSVTTQALFSPTLRAQASLYVSAS